MDLSVLTRTKMKPWSWLSTQKVSRNKKQDLSSRKSEDLPLWLFLAQVSDSSLSPDGCPLTCLEPFTVRRLSCRSVQLPPLAFRQAEQYYCERRPETETAQPRPTSLPLRAPPLIAITSAENSRYCMQLNLYSPSFCLGYRFWQVTCIYLRNLRYNWDVCFGLKEP